MLQDLLKENDHLVKIDLKGAYFTPFQFGRTIKSISNSFGKIPSWNSHASPLG